MPIKLFEDTPMTKEEPTRLGTGAVPLQGVTVEATIRDYAARTIVTQRYCNVESQPIEAVYVFPLDEGAAVCGFEAIVDGARIVGKVKEREEAFEDYDDAIAAGHGAYLLDQEKPDVFTASLGNIPPGKEVAVRITTVSELPLEGDDVRFVVPTTVSPRYAPPKDQKGVGRSPAETLNPPLAWSVPYGLTLTVDVEMSSPVKAVESPSHAVSVAMDGGRVRVQLSEREAALDADFVLKVRLADSHVPMARVERGPDGKTYAQLAFSPRFETAESRNELVFLVDRSGSMQGSSIAEARNALQLCLRSLSPGTPFNIVGFGSSYKALFPESRPYNDASLAEASRHVSDLDADMGGTELLPALTFVLDRAPQPGRTRQLFILTDGQVSNTEEVIALARKNSVHTRVFTFGVGAGASHHLVRGLARAGEGAAEFIAPRERIEGKVLRQLRKALAPAVRDATIDWEGLGATQAPHHVPPVFEGGRVVVYGLLENPRKATVTLTGKLSSGEAVSFPIVVDPAPAQEDSLVATLWARSTIRDLEEGMSPLHDRMGSLQERGRSKEDRVKKEIVRLAVAYGLTSRETSYVAIEQRETPVEGEAVLRKVPIVLTRGWGGMPVGLGYGGIGSAMSVTLSAAPAADMAAGMALHETVREPRYRAFRFGGKPATRPLDRLVPLQRADGSWDLTTELAEVVGKKLRHLRKAVRGAQGDAAEAERALATALALEWLQRNAADARDEWLLLAAKAEIWLRSVKARPAAGGDWRTLARSVF
jgi:Ca-activated chloride channel homolog